MCEYVLKVPCPIVSVVCRCVQASVVLQPPVFRLLNPIETSDSASKCKGNIYSV